MGDFDRNFDRKRSGRSRGRDSGRFDRGRSGRFGGRGRDRRSERHEMHSAICDKCGKDCEVPFKPTEGKPIYCNDCFKDKSREAGSRSESGKQSNENFDQINKKLDKILKILEAAPVEEKEKPELKKAKKKK
jgi:CxxC-x17-CxxC domain-containing protein|tara:strand:+ start:206 stop:601 length:396 start_codon:yes stop_codon:yes gene_type:complete